MQRRVLWFFSTCLALFFFGVPQASAQSAAPPAVYVVEVNGDRVDAARIRAAVARELTVTAVAPDDPRAASAVGTIKVDASTADKTLTVTFRKAELPVIRTVRLPDDPARAEVAAVFLAGNLARDEAKELLGGMKTQTEPQGADPAASAPGLSPKQVAEGRDDEDLRRLRIVLRENANHAKRRIQGAAVAGLGIGAAAVPTGIIMIAEPGSDESVRVGNLLIGFGAGAIGGGLLALAMSNDPDVGLHKKALQLEAEGGSSAEVLSRIEAEWGAQASAARSSRRTYGTLAVVLGGILVSGAFVLESALPPNSRLLYPQTLLVGVGAVELGAGIFSLMVESRIEVSYQTWRAMREPAAPTATRARPSVGFAPLPGGGALSLGLTF